VKTAIVMCLSEERLCLQSDRVSREQNNLLHP
jgi:hypothetical protein